MLCNETDRFGRLEKTIQTDKKVNKVPSSYHTKSVQVIIKTKENSYNWNHFKPLSKFLKFQISIIGEISHMCIIGWTKKVTGILICFLLFCQSRPN